MTSTTDRRGLLLPETPEDFHDYRVDRYHFTIFVGGDPEQWNEDGHLAVETGVEYRMADRFDINLSYLTSLDPERPILVKAFSCGGCWDEGMQMFGAILSCPNPVTWMGAKYARSMTSIIPLAADRFVLRLPTKYMIHHGEYDFAGKAGEEASTEYEELLDSQKIMLDLYAERLSNQGKFAGKKSRGQIKNMLRKKMRDKVDFWLTGQAAVEWGFVDDVFTNDWDNLRATEVNEKRRESMTAVLSY